MIAGHVEARDSSIARTLPMNGSGPQQKTVLSMKSGASIAASRVDAPAQTMPAMSRLMPLHEEAEIEPRHLTRENFELRSEEEIVRAAAQEMKVTSVSGAQSAIQRVIDIIGVTPDPAEMKDTFQPG